ncbi:MAG: FprA family A-type flavoprotein [Alphaproteobacteria bacterium]|nr:FprA family A-type flavoprotein [Alphaproteobacteria bacterium]
MHNTQNVTSDLVWLGANDRRLALFENVYPIPNGISYNSYLLLDEKTVLFDTVDAAVRQQFFENLQFALNGRSLDYIVIHHMEPDHCAELAALLQQHTETTVVCNVQTKKMIEQFFDLNLPTEKYLPIKEGDSLNTGRHTLNFVAAPMVHWPEVMMTYDATDKILFSADAFGTFGALNGNIFADEVPFESTHLYEARRYYTNIVGKYGPQVQNVLKKAGALDIAMICPLHGFVWRKDLDFIIGKYAKWSAYEPEDKEVVIAYGSIYGNTANAAEILATKLAERGVRNVRVYDVSVTHPSYIISEAFRVSALVFAAPTYNAGIFVNTDNLLRELTAHNLQNRTIALMDNGTWAPLAAKQMADEIAKWKNCTVLEPKVSLKSALKKEQIAEIEVLADALVQALRG